MLIWFSFLLGWIHCMVCCIQSDLHYISRNEPLFCCRLYVGNTSGRLQFDWSIVGSASHILYHNIGMLVLLTCTYWFSTLNKPFELIFNTDWFDWWIHVLIYSCVFSLNGKLYCKAFAKLQVKKCGVLSSQITGISQNLFYQIV